MESPSTIICDPEKIKFKVTQMLKDVANDLNEVTYTIVKKHKYHPAKLHITSVYPHHTSFCTYTGGFKQGM